MLSNPSITLSNSHTEYQTIQPKNIKHLSIALLSVKNPHKKHSLNKDLNGGFGTADNYEGFFLAGAARKIKQNAVRIPVIGFAHLQGILKKKCRRVRYFEKHDNWEELDGFDIILLHGTIVDYKHELDVWRRLKELHPSASVGFWGEFPTSTPEIFTEADFIIIGEPENFFQYEFHHLSQLKGRIKVGGLTDYNELPTLDLEDFPLKNYNYSFSSASRRFITYQGSKGCPYSCSYYCTYGKFQGPKIRQREPRKIVQDMIHMHSAYEIDFIQFRDPVFGLKKGFIDDFCLELEKHKPPVRWGIETRLDLLDEEKLKRMYDAGLRVLNVGIETSDPVVAKKNKRLLVAQKHQDKLIKYCDHIGIKVSAFYIFGLESDTMESIVNTIKYAKQLNTPVARFSVATPYPGTQFYAQLERENRLLTTDYEQYTQFKLVFRHENLLPKQINELLGKAYRGYYFRPSYILLSLKWFFRDTLERLRRKQPS